VIAASLASGLLSLALDAGLLLLCSRRVRAVSAWAALIMIVMPFLVTGRAVLTGGVVAPVDLIYGSEPWRSAADEHGIDGIHNPILSDVIHQILPWQAAVRYAYRAGDWPLLNPFILGGDPLAASAQPAPYWPITLIGLLLPLVVLPNLIATTVLFAAALGTFLFVRDLDVGEGGALVAAVGFALSSFLMFWLLWPLGASAAMLPWVLLGVRRVCAAPGPSSIAGLAASFVLLLLAGHPETALHVVVVGGLYSLFELAQARGRRLRAAASGVAAGAVALALTAAFLLPILDAMPQTFEHPYRAKIYAAQDRSVSLAEAVRRLRVNLLPFAEGVPGREFMPSEGKGWLSTPSAYVGSVLLAPALLGLTRGRWRGRWVLAAIGVFGAAAHVSAPLVADLLARLPLLDIAINERLGFAGAFVLAVLAGLGVETWRREPSSRRLALLGAAVVATLGALLVWLRPAMLASGLSAPFVTEQSWWLLLPPGLAAIVGALRPGRPAVSLLLAALAVQRLGEMGDFYPTLPIKAFAPRVAPIDAIPPRDTPFRVVGELGTFTPNVSALYGLEDVRGYQAMNLSRRRWTDELWSDRVPVWSNRVEDLTDPFLSFLGVRYAFQPRARPIPRGWSVVARTPGCRLVENRRALERAFVPRRVVLGMPAPQIFDAMAGETDFARRAWIEAPAPGRRQVREVRNGPGTVLVNRHGTGLDLTVDMLEPGWVVVSQTAWRGWRAVSRGEELPLAFANLAYLGLHLDAGRHEIELRYRPLSFVVGRAVTLATASAILIGLAVTPIAGRRWRAAGPRTVARCGWSAGRRRGAAPPDTAPIADS
jgi:hypothetical protein